jgi:tetratricopeptide (TPR) repeat protein
LLRVQLADVLASQNDPSGAIAQLREGLRLDPDAWMCANNLAWILATNPDAHIRNGAEAVRLAERVNRRVFAPDQPSLSPFEQVGVLDTLAAAYAESARFDEAADVARRALAIARDTGDANLIDALNSRLKLYETEQPYRS